MVIGFLRAIALAMLKLPLTLIGLPVVWVALPHAKPEGEALPFTQFPQYGDWWLERLPRWALWWDNAFDGMLGDKRGWWANECKGEHISRKNMWRWAALRNPANYFARNVCGVDVSGLRIDKVAGTIDRESVAPYRGWMLLKGMGRGRKVYPRFYAEFAIYKTYGLMFDIGWKIKLSHNGLLPDAPEKDRLKGIVCVVSPFKELS